MDEEDFHRLEAQLTEQIRSMAGTVDGIAQDVADHRKALTNMRAPSMAQAISRAAPAEHDFGGEFIAAVAKARSNDSTLQAEGKATLAGLSRFVEQPPGIKATLGSTDATGGWIIPNAMVDEIMKPAEYAAPVLNLVTKVNGVAGAAVDIPVRNAAPSRATIVAYGDTKENVDVVYDGYSATMYTLARIYDISNQFLRQSQGAAERDVVGELGHALALGQAYYLFNGSGSSQPYGLLTALTNSPAAFTSSFTAAATQAGSVIAGIGKAIAALAARNRISGLAAVVSPTSMGVLMTQGADTAGFYAAGIAGNQALPGFAVGTPVVYGVPVISDAQMAEDRLVVGQFRALKVYYGMGVRIDSSNVAGTRWDTNETGFRGELEFALDARPAVYAGAFQQITDLVP